MRTLFALLTLCLSTLTFAADTQYRDEDTGFMMTIPNGFTETWYVRNYICDFDVKIFNTHDNEEEEVAFIAIAKAPLSCCLDEDISELVPLMFEQIQESLDETLFDDVMIKLVPMPSLLALPGAQAFHIEIITDDTEDQVMKADFHLFFENGYVTSVITGGVFSEQFLDLTNRVLSGAHFITESKE